MQLKITTYNLRMSYLDSEEENIWACRKPRLLQSIKDLDADILGLQEVDFVIRDEVLGYLEDEYESRFFSPYASDGNANKMQGILVKKSRFRIVEFNWFWAGDNPHVMSKSDKGEKGEYCRGGCAARIEEKQSGKHFFVMCTHACYNSIPNSHYAPIYEQIEKELNADRLLSFFIGDMNATPEANASKCFRKYWKDAYDEVAVENRKGTEYTYTGYGTRDRLMRIDYVYFRSDNCSIKVREYECDDQLYDGQYASDHFPVNVGFEVSDEYFSGDSKAK